MEDAFPKRSRIEGTKPNILRIRSQHSKVRSRLERMLSRQISTFQEMTLLSSHMLVVVIFTLDLELDAFIGCRSETMLWRKEEDH